MTKLRISTMAMLMALLVGAGLLAQGRRGGVVRGGVRGAMVGGLLGGSSGAKVGRAVGAVAGGVKRANYRADQRVIYAESQARTKYQSTTVYRAAPRSNFHQAQPRVIVTRRVVRRR
jgi:uncharacterized protein YcfJ